MHERRALSAGTEEPGGMAASVRVMQQAPLWADWNPRLVIIRREVSW
jgi:hypothetical protein